MNRQQPARRSLFEPADAASSTDGPADSTPDVVSRPDPESRPAPDTRRDRVDFM
jgi:hypothetical protein